MTHVHFIGIGGSGLSAIARLLLESGYTVSGSDRVMSPFAADVQAAGATVYLGHSPANIAGADWVVRSSAIADDNPEVRAALAAKIPVYKRADFLGQLMERKTGIAVAGTHGKTTTTAMLAWALTRLKQDPSYLIGGVSGNLGVNAHAGKGQAFVIEADEYDRMFLGLKPRIEVVTNLEHDHPDCYPTFADMESAFESFVDLLPANGTLVACADDPGTMGLVQRAQRNGRQVVSYSVRGEITVASPHWVMARNLRTNEQGGFSFEAYSNLDPRHLKGQPVALQVPGRHNVQNALAAMAVAGTLKLSLEKTAAALEEFNGTGRRFEKRGEARGVRVFDDYAHHPTEIRATLAAARARYPKQRIWAVWQPHTYSRTRTLFDAFLDAFTDADEVIVTEIYAAREGPEQAFSADQIVKVMPHDSARFIPQLSDVSDFLIQHLRSGDVLLVLSAGDADRVSAEVLAGLK